MERERRCRQGELHLLQTRNTRNISLQVSRVATVSVHLAAMPGSQETTTTTNQEQHVCSSRGKQASIPETRTITSGRGRLAADGGNTTCNFGPLIALFFLLLFLFVRTTRAMGRVGNLRSPLVKTAQGALTPFPSLSHPTEVAPLLSVNLGSYLFLFLLSMYVENNVHSIQPVRSLSLSLSFFSFF